MLSKIDLFIPPTKNKEGGTKIGWLLSIFLVLGTLTYGVLYIRDFYNLRTSNLRPKQVRTPTLWKTGFQTALHDWGRSGFLFELRCLNENGCYYSPDDTNAVASEDLGNKEATRKCEETEHKPMILDEDYQAELIRKVNQKYCRYVQYNETVPVQHSCVKYNSDPFSSFSGSWFTSNVNRPGFALKSTFVNVNCMDNGGTVEQCLNEGNTQIRQFSPNPTSSQEAVSSFGNVCFMNSPDRENCRDCDNCAGCNACSSNATGSYCQNDASIAVQVQLRSFPYFTRQNVFKEYPLDILGLLGGIYETGFIFFSVVIGLVAGIRWCKRSEKRGESIDRVNEVGVLLGH